MKPYRLVRVGILGLIVFSSSALGQDQKSAPQTMSSGANWNIKSSVSQLTGAQAYTADLESTNTMPNSIGREETATMIVRCQGGKLEVYIAWPAFMGTDERVAQYKFDDGPIWKQLWESSESGTATFIPEPDVFLSKLALASKFVVDTDPYQRATVEAVFNTTGAITVARGAMTACSVSIPPAIAQNGPFGVRGAIIGTKELTAMHLSLDHGFMIVAVDPGTIAEKAGLKREDIIATIGGAAITSVDDLRTAISSHSGKQVTVTIWRGGQALDIPVTMP